MWWFVSLMITPPVFIDSGKLRLTVKHAADCSSSILGQGYSISDRQQDDRHNYFSHV
jgi:hypothetical protein